MDDDVVAALAAQQDELSDIVGRLGGDDWIRASRCAGWSILDVVLHLAQTDEMALASLRGTFTEAAGRLVGGTVATTIDEAADAMVSKERGLPAAEIAARWRRGARSLREEFGSIDPHRRVTWVAGELSARSLATTRLAELWIHTGDIADALGVVMLPTDRLRPIARLAWRTLPYAFAKAGRRLRGPVRFELRGPLGVRWDLAPDRAPLTTIRGDAEDLCLVAARRVDPSATTLHGEGPDADAVLELVRTYA